MSTSSRGGPLQIRSGSILTREGTLTVPSAPGTPLSHTLLHTLSHTPSLSLPRSAAPPPAPLSSLSREPSTRWPSNFGFAAASRALGNPMAPIAGAGPPRYTRELSSRDGPASGAPMAPMVPMAPMAGAGPPRYTRELSSRDGAREPLGNFLVETDPPRDGRMGTLESFFGMGGTYTRESSGQGHANGQLVWGHRPV